ncbi:spore germination protein [Clostridium magnum]|uniref:Spore germination protein B1 n=1 Tax=Clostridium magnum DSM 2767 TaxID=1121326 RepID=A0A162RT56_9CLOT|nr:spore germination protein [Clostridium magnum]KZL90341.1 spore germination protein B1 [Clostridium magnum DSM 2767]SHH82541.1 spore germination protein [Clostridium magnum DSM 2767]
MSIFNKFRKNPNIETKISSENYIYEKLKRIQVFNNVDNNAKVIETVFDNNSGIIQRKLSLSKQNIPILIVYVDGMIDKQLVTENIIKPILAFKDSDIENSDISINYVKEKVITSNEIKEGFTFDVLVYEILCGNTIVFFDGCSTSFIISNNDMKGRNIEKPDTEQSVRGGKQAFVESLNTNIVLLRKMIKTPDLNIEILNIGKRTKTSVAIVYLKGVINKDLPQAIRNKINEIDIDGIVASNQIQALIQKHKWTVFPQMAATERVDRITSAILEGRAAILVDQTPYVLIVPTTFNLFLSTPDDYYEKSIITSLLRIIRYLGFFEACSISALYIALTTYHPGLLPTSLALSITGTRVSMPFTVTLEILIMETALYLIQEAAIRLPKAVGQTVGIVGALVIGQSVVQAGIVSPIIVVIVALSAISSYTLPNYTFSLSTIAIRLFLIICATFLGLFGFVIGAFAVLVHAASLENFGIKYLSDYSPYNKETLKDTFIIAPLHIVHKRPEYLETEDTVRAKNDKRDDLNE